MHYLCQNCFKWSKARHSIDCYAFYWNLTSKHSVVYYEIVLKERSWSMWKWIQNAFMHVPGVKQLNPLPPSFKLFFHRNWLYKEENCGAAHPPATQDRQQHILRCGQTLPYESTSSTNLPLIVAICRQVRAIGGHTFAISDTAKFSVCGGSHVFLAVC